MEGWNKPQTHVSFSATQAFQQRWPDEAKRQQEAFETASWQKQKCEEIHDKLIEQSNPLLETQVPRHDEDLLFAALFGLGFGVLICGAVYFLFIQE